MQSTRPLLPFQSNKGLSGARKAAATDSKAIQPKHQQHGVHSEKQQEQQYAAREHRPPSVLTKKPYYPVPLFFPPSFPPRFWFDAGLVDSTHAHAEINVISRFGVLDARCLGSELQVVFSTLFLVSLGFISSFFHRRRFSWARFWGVLFRWLMMMGSWSYYIVIVLNSRGVACGFRACYSVLDCDLGSAALLGQLIAVASCMPVLSSAWEASTALW